MRRRLKPRFFASTIAWAPLGRVSRSGNSLQIHRERALGFWDQRDRQSRSQTENRALTVPQIAQMR